MSTMILKTSIRSASNIQQIRERINYITLMYDLDITFDNTITNRYKLIINDKESIFTTYSDVIHTLDFLINCAKSK